MQKQRLWWVLGSATVLLAAALSIVYAPVAHPQGGEQAVVYTYVSQFQVPRANWAMYAQDTERTFIPAATRMMADGTITGYETFENLVHTPEGMTNGAAWSSRSIAGVLKLLDEMRAAGPRPAQVAATKHEDFLMQSTMYAANPASTATSGYLRVLCSMAKPDKPADYTAALKKYIWPMVEEQINKGALSYAGVDTQYVITSPASEHCVVLVYPNAQSLDQWANAVNALLGGPQNAARQALADAVVPDSRRDILARITRMGHK